MTTISRIPAKGDGVGFDTPLTANCDIRLAPVLIREAASVDGHEPANSPGPSHDVQR